MEQQKLPNATIVLILGIVSIVGCCCYGLPGLICGIIGVVLYNKDKVLYQQKPQLYSNFSNLNTGRILCIIGIIFSILFLLYIVFIISIVGLDSLSDPEIMRERLEEAFGR